MHVVSLMTTRATHGLTNFPFNRFTVASQALHPFMCPLQIEVSLRIVVEPPVAPTIGVMAMTALGAKVLLMFIIRLVAFNTLQRRVLVGGHQVTLFTRDYSV